MIYGQAICLAIFSITGIAIGILFDSFRILRKSFRTANWITYLQDILFWLFTGAIILFSVFKFNHGELRSYVFFGITFGFIFYLLTISKFFIRYCVILIKFLKKVLWAPFHILCHIFAKPIHFFVINIRHILKKATKFTKKIDKNSKKAEGFLQKM